MAETVQRTTIIDQNWLDANRNEKAGDSAFQRTLDYCGSSNGAFRVLQGVGRTIRLGDEIANQAGFSADNGRLIRELGIATSAMGIARLPSATADAIKSLGALNDDKDPTDLSRKIGNAVKDTTEAVSAYGYVASFVTRNPAVLTFAQAAELASDVTDLNLSVSDYNSSVKLEKVATGRVKETVTHTKNYYLFRIIKAIMSIAGAILGFAMLATGGPLLPALALIVLALATTLFAVIRDNHKNLGQYKVINFDRQVRLA